MEEMKMPVGELRERLKNESWIACNALKVNQALLGVLYAGRVKQVNPLWLK